MLKTKHIVILAVVLAVLVGISLLQRASHRRATSRPSLAVLLDGAWTADELGRLALGFGEDAEAVVLEHDTDGWVVASHWRAKASSDRIEAVLRVLGGLEGEFRSDNADVLDDYALDGVNTVTVRGFDRQGTEIFALGLYNGPARPGSRHFLHLEVVKEDRTEVDEIILFDGEGERRLVKEFAVPEPAADDTTGAEPVPDRLTWEWRLAAPANEPGSGGPSSGEPSSGEPLAKTRADGVLGSLVTIRGVDVEDPTADPASYGLDTPGRRATLVFADGRRLELEFGDTREPAPDRPVGVRMRIAGDPTVWVVTEYTVNNIFKPTEDLRPES